MNVSQPPSFSLEQARAILERHYRIEAAGVSPLPSERDQNFRAGDSHVLKIANRMESRAMLEAENRALALASAAGISPRLIQATDGGQDIVAVDGHMIRLITLLPGRPMGARKRKSPEMLASLGATLGRLSASLAGFDAPVLHRDFHWDLARATDIVAQHLPLVRDPAIREAVQFLSHRYRQRVAPLLADLRQSVIHNDANDYNVIVNESGSVSGIIDFGDMVCSQTVNEVAIAMAYSSLDQPDPLQAMAMVLGGYHRVFPLTEAELSVVFDLACMRLCASACLAAKQQELRPDDDYLGISQQPIRNTLPKLASIHPRFACYLLRDACGLEPAPAVIAVRDWLARNRKSFAPVIAGHLQPIDMSAGSPLVTGDPAGNRPAPLWERLRAAGKIPGAGGYGEARTLYIAPAFGSAGFEETRSIHLGVDLTAEAGTPVHAFADGVVHSFEDADQAFDYGPVVVLRHDADGQEFFTLYGHLSRSSMARLQIGQNIAKGECFAEIGSAEENGGWWPHVHMQVIVDMMDTPCNFNGSALPRQRRVWMSICPDPNLILGLDPPYAPQTLDLEAKRRQRTGGNLSVSYSRNPVEAVRGWMQYLYDSSGRRYLDAYNNVPHVGHCHPRVVEAVARQMAVLNTNTRYLQHQLTGYADALTATLPRELEVCFFVASGSEANELALRLARAYTGAKDLLVMDAAYHGHTSTLIDISPYKHDGPGGMGAPDWVHKTPIPDVYRGRHTSGLAYAAEVGEVIDKLRANRGPRICGYIAETCPSVAGQILLPEGFLPEVYRLTRAAGGVCIADEVQTGFGRMGTHFWAFEMHGVIPDIVVLGKPIANGYPMGAVICRREIADAFDNGMEFFSTFGGSTAALAAAHETLRVTLDEGLQERARRVGSRLLSGLRTQLSGHPLVGDVRGSGLFAGVELVRDRTTREPAGSEASYVANRIRERGVLLGTDGPAHNVIKIRGPMQISEPDVDALVAILAETLDEIDLQ